MLPGVGHSPYEEAPDPPHAPVIQSLQADHPSFSSTLSSIVTFFAKKIL